LFFSQNQIKGDGIGLNVICMGNEKCTQDFGQKNLNVRNHTRHEWEGNIKMDLKGIGWEFMD
jgi:hypothetical protein